MTQESPLVKSLCQQICNLKVELYWTQVKIDSQQDGLERMTESRDSLLDLSNKQAEKLEKLRKSSYDALLASVRSTLESLDVITSDRSCSAELANDIYAETKALGDLVK